MQLPGDQWPRSMEALHGIVACFFGLLGFPGMSSQVHDMSVDMVVENNIRHGPHEEKTTMLCCFPILAIA